MATSKLQIAVGNMLDKTFPQFTIRENYRPEWLLSSNLTRLELDFYIEELNIAFEIQGIQHCEYTPFFHNDYGAFEKRKQYDMEKKDLCYGNGTTLIEIFALMDAIIAIGDLGVINFSPRGPIEIICPPRRQQKRKKCFPKKPKPKVEINIYISVREYLYADGRLSKYTKLKKEASSSDPKINELRSFYKKIVRGYKKGDRLFRFVFDYLDEIEKNAILEELEQSRLY